MIENFTHKGEWFLPKNPEYRISGILNFDGKNDAELDLFGVFDNAENNKIREQKFILGITTLGRLITLFNSVELVRNHTNGLASSKFSSHYVIIGKHFATEEKFTFFKVKGTFKNLDRWVGKYGFEIKSNWEEVNPKIKLTYESPKRVNFKISKDLSGSIDFNFTVPLNQNRNNISIKQTASISVLSENNLPFRKVLDYLILIQNFLTIGTLESAYPTNIELFNNNGNLDSENGISECSLIYMPNFSYTDENPYQRFLFFYTDIEHNFETIIQKWFSLKDQIDPVTNLLLDSFYSKGKSLENRLLNIVQSLETFHRRLKNRYPFPKKEYDKWLKDLIELTDEKYKVVVKNKLDFGNEPTLHDRLKELIDNLQIETLKKVIPNTERFIIDTKNTRNYFTHYSSSLEKKALKNGDLFELIEKLRILLIGSVLLETGFTLTEINSLFLRIENYHYQFLLKK